MDLNSVQIKDLEKRNIELENEIKQLKQEVLETKRKYDDLINSIVDLGREHKNPPTFNDILSEYVSLKIEGDLVDKIKSFLNSNCIICFSKTDSWEIIYQSSSDKDFDQYTRFMPIKYRQYINIETVKYHIKTRIEDHWFQWNIVVYENVNNLKRRLKKVMS